MGYRDPDAPKSRKSKRRWMQFSIRAMLLGIAIVALVLGLYMRAVRRQQAVVRVIEEAGGYVVYDEGPDPNPFTTSADPFAPGADASDVKPARKPWLSSWIASHLGKDFVYDVVSVNLVGTSDADGTLSRVGDLRALRVLRLRRSDVTDAGLACLADLSCLTDLDLSDTDITYAALQPIRGLLPQLDYLGLECTRVTATEEAALRQALPYCWIARQMPVTEAIERTCPLDFIDTPLVDVTEFMEDSTGAGTVFDDDAVEFQLCPVSVEGGEVPLEEALRRVLGPLGLTYRVDQVRDVVIVTRK